ncbi:MAG: PAS domain-containing protein [Candidatus Sericytochromatia bacterium]|nr:PAS domain-containing protein [Candidatus Sericytochromatia bacterium]
MALFQDGVILLEPDGKIRLIDSDAAEILGLTPETVAGQLLSEIWPEPALHKLQQQLAEGKPQAESEFVSTALKKQKTLSLRLGPLPASETPGQLLLVRDLTAVRRLETIERDFITNVSHELRTPLTSIKMAAESLQMGAIANEKLKARFLSNIQREADRLTRLLNELLVLSNVSGAETPLHLSSFELAGLVEDVMSTMTPHARVNDIELVCEAPDSLPEMLADRDRLLQVLINLVDNAIKCNRPNGSVTLRAATEGETVIFQVVDTGIGIPSLDLPRIFDRFFRVDKARSRVTGGTGLGLSLVKDIVESHSGTIDVESTINVGTTFTMRLPLKTPVEADDDTA